VGLAVAAQEPSLLLHSAAAALGGGTRTDCTGGAARLLGMHADGGRCQRTQHPPSHRHCQPTQRARPATYPPTQRTAPHPHAPTHPPTHLPACLPAAAPAAAPPAAPAAAARRSTCPAAAGGSAGRGGAARRGSLRCAAPGAGVRCRLRRRCRATGTRWGRAAGGGRSGTPPAATRPCGRVRWGLGEQRNGSRQYQSSIN
jgi:hypothetical protein